MNNPHLSKRTLKILQFIKDKHYPSINQIFDYLKTYDLVMSYRTFHRDLKKLRTDFGIEITYNRVHNGYFINKEESIDIPSFFRFLELVSLAELFSDGLRGDKKLMEYVHFDETPELKGIENLQPILIAIKQACKLSFTHYNYYKDTAKAYTISPLMVKEYLKRWYVIGVIEGTTELRIFGIDRLSKIQQGELTTVQKKDFQEELDKFKDIVGVRINETPKERIIIQTDQKHMRYLKSLPLHHSQVILDDKNPEAIKISYEIRPNYEFDTQILKMSFEVEVLEPMWYREHIKSKIEAIYKKYKA
ncbi:helix-turn-helix transcriptional regulator [Formosa sp. 4Alg 33]|uniref:helix-turn-helix transcriptional regulator n=1 Tax=Formosa sp. 4Alg 33 TaxID=3382189 RepID=UPI003D9C1FC7